MHELTELEMRDNDAWCVILDKLAVGNLAHVL